MEQDEMLHRLEDLVARDPCYKLESYVFVINALEYTMAKLERSGHVSGTELLEGVKEFARERFGLMTKMVFEHWGISKTDDFGEIVFTLVNAGVLGKTETDSKEDFKNVYDFDEAFGEKCDWGTEEV